MHDGVVREWSKVEMREEGSRWTQNKGVVSNQVLVLARCDHLWLDSGEPVSNRLVSEGEVLLRNLEAVEV